MRYRSYGSEFIASNVGEGMVDPAALEVAGLDSMTKEGVPSAINDALNSKALLQDQQPSQWSRWSTNIAALRLLQKFGDVPVYRKEAEKAIAELTKRKALSADEAKARQALT